MDYAEPSAAAQRSGRRRRTPVRHQQRRGARGRHAAAGDGVSTPTLVAVDGRRTRVRVDGDPHNPPVLLLHGVGRSLDWATQWERLSGAYRVITLDIPGFGFSSRPSEPMTLRALAQGVVEPLDVLGEPRPLHVIGNSLGGAVALQLLEMQPHRVASLVLVNSAGFGREVTLLLRMLTLPVIGRMATRRTTRAGPECLNARSSLTGRLPAGSGSSTRSPSVASPTGAS